MIASGWQYPISCISHVSRKGCQARTRVSGCIYICSRFPPDLLHRNAVLIPAHAPETPNRRHHGSRECLVNGRPRHSPVSSCGRSQTSLGLAMERVSSRHTVHRPEALHSELFKERTICSPSFWVFRKGLGSFETVRHDVGGLSPFLSAVQKLRDRQEAGIRSNILYVISFSWLACHRHRGC